MLLCVSIRVVNECHSVLSVRVVNVLVPVVNVRQSIFFMCQSVLSTHISPCYQRVSFCVVNLCRPCWQRVPVHIVNVPVVNMCLPQLCACPCCQRVSPCCQCASAGVVNMCLPLLSTCVCPCCQHVSVSVVPSLQWKVTCRTRADNGFLSGAPTTCPPPLNSTPSTDNDWAIMPAAGGSNPSL